MKNTSLCGTALALLVALLAGGVVLAPAPVYAQIEVIITEGVHKGIPITVAPFIWKGATDTAPESLGAVLRSDLLGSGRFEVIDTADVQYVPPGGGIDFSGWRARKLDNAVIGSLEQLAPDRYRVKVMLLDVHRGLQLDMAQYEVNARFLRKAAHQSGNMVFEKLVGVAGVFDTRIAYVADETNRDVTRYSLNVADYDGHNPVEVLSSSYPIMSPTWSPDGKTLAYVLIEKGRSMVYVQKLADGSRRKIAAYPGINSAPAWSPDGTQLALSLSRSGDPEIYLHNFNRDNLRRITDNPAIDTEPAWSPDGLSIVFTSDRSGTPQIYMVALDQITQPKRLTFSGNYNAAATFSPDGTRLLLISSAGGNQRVGMLDVGGSDIFTLTRTSYDESPVFAPNGSMFLYSTREAGRNVIYRVSDDGGTITRPSFQGRANVRDPAWSPFTSSAKRNTQ